MSAGRRNPSPGDQVLMLRICGAISPLCHTFSWRGAQMKYKDKFGFTFYGKQSYIKQNLQMEKKCMMKQTLSEEQNTAGK
jgi:hypothetical protein